MKRFLCAHILTLMLLTGMVHAQNEDLSLLISASASIPNGDYAEKIGDGARFTRQSGFYIGDEVGLAQPGFGIGLELNTPVLTDGLGWLISVRYIYNSTDPSTAQKTFRQIRGDTVDFVYETDPWHNLPIMTGFRYSYPFSPNFAASAFVQGGINFSKAATRTGTLYGVKGEETTFKFTRDFGYEVGLGIDLYKNWQIRISYLDLNTPRFEGTRMLSEIVFPGIVYRENYVIGEDRSISMFLITLGYYIVK